MPRHTPILTAEDIPVPLKPVSVQPLPRPHQNLWMMGLGLVAALLSFLFF